MNDNLGRREFFRKVGEIAGGAAFATVLVPHLQAGPGEASQIVPKDDPRLETGYITYPVAGGEFKAYSARPKGAGKLPGVVTIHENRGLTAHHEDVARRVALEGFHVLAPDALSLLGGTPADPQAVGALYKQLDPKATALNFVAAVLYLKTGPQSTGKVGCMGFCWGGGMTNQVAVNSPDLTAAVPFYGMPPAVEDVPKIKAAMLCHYAGDDARINAAVPAFEEAMKKAGVSYTIHMYEGAGHAFFNDTGARYNKAAADLAWQRTIAFYKEKLKT